VFFFGSPAGKRFMSPPAAVCNMDGDVAMIARRPLKPSNYSFLGTGWRISLFAKWKCSTLLRLVEVDGQALG
jgi:hypothetical protein